MTSFRISFLYNGRISLFKIPSQPDFGPFIFISICIQVLRNTVENIFTRGSGSMLRFYSSSVTNLWSIFEDPKIVPIGYYI